MTKREQTRQRIIKESANLFNKQGFGKTSIDDIMQNTGLKKGGIYGNFKNKEEITVEAFEYSVKLVTQRVKELTDKEFNTIDKLKIVIEFYRNYLIDPPIQGGCPILNTSIEADNCKETNPILKKRVINALDNWKGSLQGTIIKGQLRNEIIATVNADKFSTVFIAMLEGGILLSKAYSDTIHLDIVLDRLEKMIDEELIVA